MSPFTQELIALCRLFSLCERETVCCGTVTVPQCIALQELLQSDNDVSGLTGRLGTSMSTVTRLLDGLVKKGWVDRVRDSKDRRRVLVALTDPGRKQAESLKERTDEVVKAVLSKIPEDKHDQCLESMQLIHSAMDQLRKTLNDCSL
jgi:MarR family transcriptional regulator, organic hydroperoxide resistance regulator